VNLQDTTEIGGQDRAFPQTSWTLIRNATGVGPSEAKTRLGALLATYWKPVYHFIRVHWRKSNEDAKDLTQGFFSVLLEGGELSKAAQEHGTFRSYLKAMLGHFLVDEHRRSEALKRGGAAARISMELAEVDSFVADPETISPEAAFDRAWISTLMAQGMKDLESALRSEGREFYFHAFQLYYLTEPSPSFPESTNQKDGEAVDPSHESVANQLGLQAYDVNNYLIYARRKLRLLLKERISSYSATEKDALQEFGFLLSE